MYAGAAKLQTPWTILKTFPSDLHVALEGGLIILHSSVIIFDEQVIDIEWIVS